MKHFNVLTMVIVLIVGVWAAVEFRQRSRRFPGSRLGGLGLFLVFFNVAATAAFLGAYGRANLGPTQLAGLSFWYRFVEWPVLTVLILGVHLSLYTIIFRRLDRDLPKWVVPAAGVFAAGVLAWFFLVQRLPALAPQRPENTFWLVLVWPPGILDLVWLGRLLVGSRKASEPGRRKVDAALAWLFLARYPMHLALSVWNPHGGANWAAIACARLLGVYTNLVPVLWLRAYFVPWAGSLGKIIAGRVDLPSLRKKRGLSAREMEILELMLDGKSYKEIESALHISIHTVKSHVYSLYRKMEVKSRHQLIHRIGVYGRGDGPAAPADRPDGSDAG